MITLSWIARPRGVLTETKLEQTVAMLEEVETKTERQFDRYSDFSKLDAIDVSLDMGQGCLHIFQLSLHGQRERRN